jgi:excisionase family DNA binding protein
MYTLKESAEAVGMTKPAIFKAIKKGTISAEKDGRGQWLIDPSELHRVYKPVNQGENRSISSLRQETEENAHGLRQEVERLREERGRERQQLQETITDLRRRLDQSETERRETQGKLTALLTHQPEPKAGTPAVPPTETHAAVRPVFWMALAAATIAAAATWQRWWPWWTGGD